jgi:hypothetical protein
MSRCPAPPVGDAIGADVTGAPARVSRRAGVFRAVVVSSLIVGAAACGSPPPGGSAAVAGFRSGDCNMVSDQEIDRVVGAGMFTKVVVNDAGCFWQERSMIGMGRLGAGMGISTWWYRGSDMNIERALEARAGRKLTELSIHGNKGFEAGDATTCSVYVAKGSDVITWSIQTMNPAGLPSLCAIIGQLSALTQDRVN